VLGSLIVKKHLTDSALPMQRLHFHLTTNHSKTQTLNLQNPNINATGHHYKEHNRPSRTSSHKCTTKTFTRPKKKKQKRKRKQQPKAHINRQGHRKTAKTATPKLRHKKLLQQLQL